MISPPLLPVPAIIHSHSSPIPVQFRPLQCFLKIMTHSGQFWKTESRPHPMQSHSIYQSIRLSQLFIFPFNDRHLYLQAAHGIHGDPPLYVAQVRRSASPMGRDWGNIAQGSHALTSSSVGDRRTRWMMRGLVVWHIPYPFKDVQIPLSYQPTYYAVV